jgi:DNA-binding NarL/FixJ family response regulator
MNELVEPMIDHTLNAAAVQARLQRGWAPPPRPQAARLSPPLPAGAPAKTQARLAAQMGVSAAALLSHSDLYEEIQRALLQVFSDTLARVARPETLDAMLAQTLRGQADAEPAASLLADLPGPALPLSGGVSPLEGLSAREYEVLQRLAAGDSNKLIARALDLSPHTVKRHVANILGKLGATSRGQAAAWLRANH